MSLCSTRPGVKLGAGGLSSWAGSMEERRPGGREREWWGVQSLAESRAMARYRGRRREAVTRRSQAAHTARSAAWSANAKAEITQQNLKYNPSTPAATESGSPHPLPAA